MNYKYDLTTLPTMLKRRHFIEFFGISSSLYYKLINKKLLPTIRFNNRTFVDRDKFIQLLKDGLLNFTNEKNEVSNK